MPINLSMKHITSLLAIVLLSGCTPKPSGSSTPPVILGSNSAYMQLSESSFDITKFNNDEQFTLYKNFLLESIKLKEITDKLLNELQHISFQELANDSDEIISKILLKYMNPEDIKKTMDQSFMERIEKNISISMKTITEDSSILNFFQSKINSFQNTNLSEYNQLHEYATKHSLIPISETNNKDIEMFDAIFKQIIKDDFNLDY